MAQITRDHETIKNWIEERGGSPSAVKGTKGKKGSETLRVDFPGYSGQGRLEKLSWEEFFDTFDKEELGFLYQDKTRDGQTSKFFKFVAADEETESRFGSRAQSEEEFGEESESEVDELMGEEDYEEEEEDVFEEDIEEEEKEEEEKEEEPKPAKKSGGKGKASAKR